MDDKFFTKVKEDENSLERKLFGLMVWKPTAIYKNNGCPKGLKRINEEYDREFKILEKKIQERNNQ